MNERDTLVQFLTEEHGYFNLCELDDGTIIGLNRYMFTCAIAVGLHFWGYERRYCYEHEADAKAAIDAWDGHGDPPGPWVKVKGAETGERLGPGAVDWIGPP